MISLFFLTRFARVAEKSGFRYRRNSAFWLRSSFCNSFTSSFRGGTLLVAAIAAAQPEAWPIAIAGAIERADWNGACSLEMHRPDSTSPSTFVGTSERYGMSKPSCLKKYRLR